MPRRPSGKPWYRKSTGQWYIQYRGKQYPLGPNKKEAEKRARHMLLQKGVGPVGKSPTFHQLLDEYWGWISANLAETTCKCRKYMILSLKEYFADNVKAEDVKPYEIDAWARQGKVASTTVNTRISIAVNIFNRGKRMGMIAANPLDMMEKPKTEIREVYVPPERFDELLRAADEISPAFRDFCQFAIETGARAAEMFDMQVDYLQDDRILFPLPESKGSHRQGHHRRRVIFLNDTSKAIAHRLAKKWKRGHLFRTHRNRPFNGDNIVYYMDKLKAKMKMPGLCATGFRHSFAHAQICAGADIHLLAQLMGHATTKMIETRYGHIIDSPRLADAANAINLTAEKEGDDEPPLRLYRA